MKNLTERIYVSPIGDNVHEAFLENPPCSVFGNCIEYIRADIAEKIAKGFALHCRVSQFDTIEKLFTEFKKQQP